VRAGLYDLNSEFDSIETGGLFLNSAHGIGTDFSQTGRNGPSIFPVTSLAVRLRASLGTGAYGQFAVLDGVPGDPDDPSSNEIDLSDEDGALIVAEYGWSGDRWRKLAVGAWLYTADFEPLASPGGPQDDGNEGWYAIADRTVWQQADASVAAFLRVGQAEERFNPYDGYIGAGTSFAGFVPARPDDEFGLAIAVGLAGDDFEASRRLDGLDTDNHETTVEMTYRAPITGWLTLQPDIQYIINPGNDPELDNALVIGLRFEVGYGRRLAGGG
jgi:porin